MTRRGVGDDEKKISFEKKIFDSEKNYEGEEMKK